MKTTFDAFFAGVWGFDPFPWQRRLSERVASEGWPDVLDLPTGSGKTAALDIALFDFVCRPDVAPRRVVLVVDRRVIVDQVAERAARIRSALEAAENDATAEIAGRLREIVGVAPNDIGASVQGGSTPLLATAVLRGGTLQDDSWARHPQVPVLAASTVDQVGSRLFFRGYGLSDGARPIHAGLLGCDTLLLLDEVHLARPFADVLRQSRRLRSTFVTNSPVSARYGVVELSATPAEVREATFTLEPEDRRHEELSARLGASKLAELAAPIAVSGDESARRRKLAERAAKSAKQLLAEGKRAVAVVVNRVETARQVATILDDQHVDHALLTGRMRPLDQVSVLETIRPRVLAGREDNAALAPLVLVATQCIEAGADFDFDGMVTECASLDALRQRFGRLDRRGRRGARAVILIRKDNLSGDDPVYGSALAATWSWLEEHGSEVDFGIDAFDAIRPVGEAAERLRPRARPAAVLMPAYLDAWSQTRPRPHVDPDVSIFLHGIPDEDERVPADVQVVWREDVEPDDPVRVGRLLESVPPSTVEALSLPIWTVKAWLSGSHEGALADVEGVADRPTADTKCRSFLVRRDAAWSWRSRATELRPGETIVVPTSYGGVGPHGTFDPNADAAVPDLGDAAQLVQRGRPVFRVLPGSLPSIFDRGVLKAEEDEPLDEIILEAFAARAEVGTVDSDRPAEPSSVVERSRARWSTFVFDVMPAKRRAIQIGRGAEGVDPRLDTWIVAGTRLTPRALRDALTRRGASDEVTDVMVNTSDTTTDDDTSSHTGARTELSDHLVGVAGWADHFAVTCALPQSLRAALRWAGRVHDVGKADPRFQLLLHLGDRVAAAQSSSDGRFLAKSGTSWLDRGTARRARTIARYPRGQRHELVSVAMLDGADALRAEVEAEGADWELVLHLVASHHGWCRPLAPVTRADDALDDRARFVVEQYALEAPTNHELARIDSGLVDRFWALTKRYGWYELAYLEAILRLADMRRSEAEQEGRS